MNSSGHLFAFTTFGESHGEAVGVVVDGCPPGIPISEEEIQFDLDRRRPGQSSVTTPRKEADQIKIYSGLMDGKTTGTPIMMMVFNGDHRSRDYSKIKDQYRPMHADYTYDMRFGIRDYRGGGRSSARETLARVAAGAIAKKALKQIGNIQVIGHTLSVGTIRAETFDASVIEENPVRCADAEAAKKMEEFILQMKKEQDSCGGVVQVVAKNVPAGLGSPTYWKLKAELASGLMGINAVQGVEYGSGFRGATMKGSEHNDEFITDDNGDVRTKTNNHGGILGGISTGEDIIVNTAFKPVSSLPRAQNSINTSLEAVSVQTFGRHEKCVVPRAVPICEAMVAVILLDHWLISQAYQQHVSLVREPLLASKGIQPVTPFPEETNED